MVSNALLKLARAVLENVVSQVGGQLRIIQEQVIAPSRGIIQTVTGGVWRGKGADAFVDEIASIMIPGVGQIGDKINEFTNNVTTAREIIERADESVERLVRSKLYDAFDFYQG
jgi:hypothetical protein